jgi:perosamine synthetase
VSQQRIPVAGPWITRKEIDYVAEAAASAWYESAGTFNRQFEEGFARYAGRRYAVSLPSCTSALHLALAALGIGAGDEVVVPDVTWIASAAPISYVGATTVFADVDERTWCLSAASLEACITPRTKAVIPVDLYGGMPDIDAILAVAQKHGVAVIEDAAEAIGSEYRGRRAGSFGKASAFSFHGSKTLTTGEGGMLVTDDDAFHARVQVLRDHGRRPGDHSFYNHEVAFKYKMSALQAALGLAQLERIEELVEKKRTIFGWYHERLRRIPEIRLNAEPTGTRNAYWMVTAIFPESWGGKAEIIRRLAAQGIDSRPVFSPLSSLPAYKGTPQAKKAAETNVISYRLGPNGVNLPSALRLTEADVERVCDALMAMKPR